MKAFADTSVPLLAVMLPHFPSFVGILEKMFLGFERRSKKSPDSLAFRIVLIPSIVFPGTDLHHRGHHQGPSLRIALGNSQKNSHRHHR